MLKKRPWGIIVKEIQLNCKILEKENDLELWENSWEKLWQELFEVSVGNFYRSSQSFLVAKEYFQEDWRVVYMEELFKKARCTEHWKFIARHTARDSFVYRVAIERVYDNTRKFNILYRWTELRKLIDIWHSLMPEVERKILEIRRKQKTKKSK